MEPTHSLFQDLSDQDGLPHKLVKGLNAHHLVAPDDPKALRNATLDDVVVHLYYLLLHFLLVDSLFL